MESHRLEFPTHHNRFQFSLDGRWSWSILLIPAIVCIVFLGIFLSVERDRVAPGVMLEEISLGGLTADELQQRLVEQQSAITLPNTTVTVTFQDKTWTASSSALGISLDTDKIVNTALLVGRQGTFLQKLRQRLQARTTGYPLPLALTYKEEAVSNFVQTVAKDVSIPGKAPSVRPQQKQLIIDVGEYGQALNAAELTSAIESRRGEDLQIEAPVEVTFTPLSADGVQHTEQRLQKFLGVTLELKLNDTTPGIPLTPDTFVSWFELPDGFRTKEMETQLTQLTQKWNNDPQNAEFVLSPDGKKLEKFVPDRMGQKVDVPSLGQNIVKALLEVQNNTATSGAKQNLSFTIPTAEAPAQIQLKDTNTLGVTERIGIGVSEFKHSIPNRIFNVDLTSKRIQATLVPAGEEFSFNGAVGDISAKSGYKTAYVIMNGRTQLGDGGGVCQVSTTVFRAALDAGLPITKWKPHSYRVGYYEQNTQPGFDATVFSPSQDFRFKNDTKHALVITTYVDTATQFMNVEIWGTSDGRTSEISDYQIWNQRSAPAPRYQEDLSLPPGTKRQVDFAAPGASTKFLYTVKDAQGNEQYKKEFVSNFRPWQAVFLVGPTL